MNMGWCKESKMNEEKRVGEKKKKKKIQWMNGMNECLWGKMRSPRIHRWMGSNEESMDE
jgi:hypothetical protein